MTLRGEGAILTQSLAVGGTAVEQLYERNAGRVFAYCLVRVGSQNVAEWAVTATLVRDNQPALTVVHVPLTGDTYTAVAGAGAHLNGQPLHVSQTPSLALSVVATSQARPDEAEAVTRRVGASITAMLFDALVVRTAVPATLHLLNVAAGQIDAFWQFAGARADLLPGALLVTEAGGQISDAEGHPWTPKSESFLAAAPGVHAEAVATLSR